MELSWRPVRPIPDTHRATATTNTAVGQYIDTLLKLSDFRHLNNLQFVSDSALADGAPTTEADLHVILEGVSTNYGDRLRVEQRFFNSYAQGQELIETVIFHPEWTLSLIDEKRD